MTSFFAALPPVCTPPCSAHATCKNNNTCECNLNYEGDGITCTGKSHLCTGGPAAGCRGGVELSQGTWAPSQPFCFLLGPLATPTLSVMGLLMPNLPTSQAMTLNLLCKLQCTSFYGVFVTLQIIQSYFIEKIFYSILRQCFPQIQLSN